MNRSLSSADASDLDRDNFGLTTKGGPTLLSHCSLNMNTLKNYALLFTRPSSKAIVSKVYRKALEDESLVLGLN